jgi:hypothetical protein
MNEIGFGDVLDEVVIVVIDKVYLIHQMWTLVVYGVESLDMGLGFIDEGLLVELRIECKSYVGLAILDAEVVEPVTILHQELMQNVVGLFQRLLLQRLCEGFRRDLDILVLLDLVHHLVSDHLVKFGSYIRTNGVHLKVFLTISSSSTASSDIHCSGCNSKMTWESTARCSQFLAAWSWDCTTS